MFYLTRSKEALPHLFCSDPFPTPMDLTVSCRAARKALPLSLGTTQECPRPHFFSKLHDEARSRERKTKGDNEDRPAFGAAAYRHCPGMIRSELGHKPHRHQGPFSATGQPRSECCCGHTIPSHGNPARLPWRVSVPTLQPGLGQRTLRIAGVLCSRICNDGAERCEDKLFTS